MRNPLDIDFTRFSIIYAAIFFDVVFFILVCIFADKAFRYINREKHKTVYKSQEYIFLFRHNIGLWLIIMSCIILTILDIYMAFRGLDVMFKEWYRIFSFFFGLIWPFVLVIAYGDLFMNHPDNPPGSITCFTVYIGFLLIRYFILMNILSDYQKFATELVYDRIKSGQDFDNRDLIQRYKQRNFQTMRRRRSSGM